MLADVMAWELYADDSVVIAEAQDNLIKRLNKWKEIVENAEKYIRMKTR